MRVVPESRIPVVLQEHVTKELKGLPFFRDFFVDGSLDPMFRALEEQGVVVVAYKDDKAVGFLAGYVLDPLFYQQRGVYTPEYGILLPEDGFESSMLFARLYDVMKERGCTHHAISNPYGKWDSLFQESGYGLIVKDGACKVDENRESSVRLEEVTLDNHADYLSMCEEHETYMAAAPIFLGEGFETNEALASLEQDDSVQFYLVQDGQRVGFTTLSHTTRAGSELLKTSRSLAVKGTHVSAIYQNKGVGRELIDALHRYAFDKGYRTLVTDFESYNVKANAFWPKHFQIVMKSYVRYIGRFALSSPLEEVKT